MKQSSIEPVGDQESVWSYPRPPRIEACTRRIRVEFAGVVIADTVRAFRVLETSHPPVYYLPQNDIQMGYLQPSPMRSSLCEWKGRAVYYSIQVGERRERDAAWAYPNPWPSFTAIKDHLAFYASKMDACWVDDEQVQPQPGDFYGGWITRHVVGPFKGSPGTSGW